MRDELILSFFKNMQNHNALENEKHLYFQLENKLCLVFTLITYGSHLRIHERKKAIQALTHSHFNRTSAEEISWFL